MPEVCMVVLMQDLKRIKISASLLTRKKRILKRRKEIEGQDELQKEDN